MTTASIGNRRTALVHDWLEKYAGAERVLEQMLNCFPDAEIYSICNFLPATQKGFLGGKEVKTSFIQRLPFARSSFRNYLALMPLAIEQFDLSSFDIVLSSSWAVAKGVITGPDQLHISYIHTPIRYAWESQPMYWSRGVKGMLIRAVLHKLRLWDYVSARRVDLLIANSHFVARRIAKCYGRRSTVIYPPVNIDDFVLEANKESYYVTSSRLVPYKRVDLAVSAFSQMPSRTLIVLGDGPELKRLKRIAGSNVHLKGWTTAAEHREYMQHARAFIFPALEDFGIAPVEAQACGTPVIAFGKGGALETVIAGETGEFFSEQTIASLSEAVERFESRPRAYDPHRLRANAERFNPTRFKAEISELIDRSWVQFRKGKFTDAVNLEDSGNLISSLRN